MIQTLLRVREASRLPREGYVEFAFASVVFFAAAGLS
jgi:hypothetical protein